MCNLRCMYGCGHIRCTVLEPCPAGLQGRNCIADTRELQPLNIKETCLVCTAQVQAQAAEAQAECAQTQAHLAQLEAINARIISEAFATKAENLRVCADAACRRVEKAKYLGEAGVRLEFRYDEQHLAELTAQIEADAERTPTVELADDGSLIAFADQMSAVAELKPKEIADDKVLGNGVPETSSLDSPRSFVSLNLPSKCI